MAVAAAAGVAGASPIDNTTGLATPGTTITFGDAASGPDHTVYAGDTPITTQYTSLGVTISGVSGSVGGTPVVYNSIGALDAINAESIQNFIPGGHPHSTAGGTVDFTFSSPVTGAAVEIETQGTNHAGTGPATTLVEALLGGVPVASFTADTSISNTPHYVGFAGITFDELHLGQPDSTDFAMVLDNLQFPEPSSAAGGTLFCCLTALARRRRAAN